MKVNLLWFICLLVRFSIVLGIFYISTLTKDIIILDNIISLILFFMGVGFVYKYITGSNNEIQISKVFWHTSRIYHGLIFIIASITYFKNYKKIASILILIDILFSFIYRTSLNV